MDHFAADRATKTYTFARAAGPWQAQVSADSSEDSGMDLFRRTAVPQRGFTLIEIMIVVVIAAILAAVAYPSFMSQVRKGRRSDAVEALARLQQAQERWRSRNPSYAAGSLLATAWPSGLGQSLTSTGGYYTIAIPGSPTATTYTATATAVSGKSQAGDTGCSTLTITVTNGNPANTPASCWSK